MASKKQKENNCIKFCMPWPSVRLCYSFQDTQKLCNYCWISNVHVRNMLKHRWHGITETVIWQWDEAFMVLTTKFAVFNTNKNQVPANISWTYQTEIFHKKWYCMQVFEHTMFNFTFLAKMKIPSSTHKVSSHVVWTLALMEWERLKFRKQFAELKIKYTTNQMDTFHYIYKIPNQVRVVIFLENITADKTKAFWKTGQGKCALC